MSRPDEANAGAPRRPRLSGLLSSSAGFVWRHPLPVLVIATLANLPEYIAYTLTDGTVDESQGWAAVLLLIAHLLLGNLVVNLLWFPSWLGCLHGAFSLFAWIITLGCVTHCIVQDARGERVDVAAALRAALRRPGPPAAVGLVVDLVPTMLGPLLLIPGYVALCALLVAVPVCIVEERGIRGSLSRSVELTRGYRLRAFLIVVVTFAVPFCLRIIDRLAPDLDTTMRVILGNIGFTFAFALAGVLIGTFYRRLRDLKDGPEGESVARVFE